VGSTTVAPTRSVSVGSKQVWSLRPTPPATRAHSYVPSRRCSPYRRSPPCVHPRFMPPSACPPHALARHSVARTPGRFPSRGPPARSLTGAPPRRSPVTRARLGRSRPSGPAAPPSAPTWRCAGRAASSTTTLAPAGATPPWRRCGGGTSAYSGAPADRHATDKAVALRGVFVSVAFRTTGSDCSR